VSLHTLPPEACHFSPLHAGIFVYGYDASLNVRNSFPVFSTHIEANYIARKEDVYSLYSLTDDDKKAIELLKKDPRIGVGV